MIKKTFTFIYTSFVFIVLVSVLVITCCTTDNSGDKSTTTTVIKKVFEIKSPVYNHMCRLNDSLEVELKLNNPKKHKPDSLIILCSGKRIFSTTDVIKNFRIKVPSYLKVGKQSLKFQLYYNSGEKESHSAGVIFLSDIEPAELNYTVIRKIKHDTEAYTQGFIYHNNMLYEGTGRYDNSSIRKINPASGEVLKKYNLESKYFGEGITILNNKIYQLTYKSGQGFIYNLGDFKLTQRFSLQTHEGWGLTTNGEVLIMSDGSAQLYFLDAEYMTVLNQIQVMSNQGEINNLNELEYVNGIIYANIYGRPTIAKIDVNSGKVLGFLNLSRLYPEGYANDMDKVLNGIAYNPNTSTFYITGKLWPAIYEIKIID